LQSKFNRKSASLRITVAVTLLLLTFAAIIFFATYAVYNSVENNFEIIVFAILLATSILFSLLIKTVIDKILEYTLRRIVEADYRFNDNLDIFIARTDDNYTSDQVSKMYKHFADVMSSFQSLLNDTNDVINQHLDGNYKARLVEDNYSGLHKKFATQTNVLLNYYIDDYLELFKVLKEYADGDFSTAIRSYEGEWHWANVIMDDLRNDLILVTSEITKLTESAIVGNFDITIDTSNQKGEWRHILTTLNKLMSATKEPLRKIKDNLVETSKGHLNMLQGDFYGEFNTVKDACNLANNKNLKIIDEISEILTGIAAGDLSKLPQHEYIGSYAPIRDALYFIIDNLNTSFLEISSTSQTLLQEANNLTSSTDKLAESATQQSSIIQELNATLNQIDESMHKGLDNLKFLLEQSDNSVNYGKESLIGMHDMLQSMNEIQESSVRISKVLRSIDDIAFQTNLLSLNASVEAARAGESGRGFAVVATEVGSLSNRSQASAKETEGLITESSQKIFAGINASKSTATALEYMVNDVRKAGELIDVVLSGFNNNVNEVDFVNKEVNGINSLVQATAATSQECANVAIEFNLQAKKLMEMISFYKLQ